MMTLASDVLLINRAELIKWALVLLAVVALVSTRVVLVRHRDDRGTDRARDPRD